MDVCWKFSQCLGMRGNGCGCDGISSCPTACFESLLLLVWRMLLRVERLDAFKIQGGGCVELPMIGFASCGLTGNAYGEVLSGLGLP